MSEIPPSFWLDENNSEFPKLSLALTEPNGLIAIGGNLSVERLLKAYSLGIFPWYGKDEPILWYSPDPRMVITPEKFHLSKSLKRVIQSSKFEVCINTAFKNVIVQCQKIARQGQSGTWINDEMIEAYCKLHESGHAHSYEVYERRSISWRFVWGCYWASFFGESMFSFVSNASKVAFAYLLQQNLYQLIDCQVENKHLESLGAFKMPRDLFIQQLKAFV